MRKPSGAGASIASGASYQTRVASYIFVLAYCGFESVIEGADDVLHIGFETAQSVDDINIRLNDGRTVFIQAKASFDFSLANGELRSVFEQFEEQHALGSFDGRFVLATTNRASRRVTENLRLALDVFRHSPDEAFFRNQPRAISDVIASVRTTLAELQTAAGRANDPNAIDAIIRCSAVVVLDVEDGGVLEQAAIVALQSKGIGTARVVWAKMIADCLEFARTRRSIWLETYKAEIKRHSQASTAGAEEAAEESKKWNLQSSTFPARGRSSCANRHTTPSPIRLSSQSWSFTASRTIARNASTLADHTSGCRMA